MRGLGTGVQEAYPFDRGNQFVNEFGPLDFQGVRRAIMNAFGQLGRHGIHHCRVIVTEDQRPVSAEMIDVFVPIDVPLPRAGGAFDIHRVRFQVPADVGDPVVQQRCGSGVQGAGGRSLVRVGAENVQYRAG